MQFFAVLALCVVAASARSAVKAPVTGPACPLNETTIAVGRPFNVSLLPILEILPGAVRDDIIVKGLEGLTYMYDINLLTTTIVFSINLPAVDLTCASYSGVVGSIDATPLRPETLPSGSFVGQGAASLSATGVKLEATVTLFVNLLTNKVSCRLLEAKTLVFDSLAASLGPEFLLEGAPIDWTAWSSTVKPNFDQDFAAFKTEILEKIRVSANNILETFTLDELLELIGGIGGEPGEPCA